MKRTLIVLCVLLLTAACCLTFFACGPAAEYTFTSASYGSLSVTGSGSDTATLVLKPNKTYTFTFKAFGYSISESGTWEKKGKTVTFHYGDAATTAEYKSGTLTWKHDPFTLVFDKK